MKTVILVIMTLCLASPATARGREPCSGKKGGVSHYLGKFFVCNDGSTSQSKRVCSKPSR